MFFHFLTLIRIKGLLYISREKGKHSWKIQTLQRNEFLTQVLHITWVLQRRIFLSNVLHIFVGDDTKMEVGGKGNMEMEHGEFKNVLYVPNLSSNVLSIYQITHLRDGHRVEFLPDSVQVHSLKDNSLVVVGKVNDHKRLYSFSHFVPKSPSTTLLHTSHRVETDTDISDSASTSSDRGVLLTTAVSIHSISLLHLHSLP